MSCFNKLIVLLHNLAFYSLKFSTALTFVHSEYDKKINNLKRITRKLQISKQKVHCLH